MLRWGGDFRKRGRHDWVHIDDGLNLNDRPKWNQQFNANQKCFKDFN